MTLPPTGCVVLCDHVYSDRGKASILGAGWTQIGGGQAKVTVAIILNIARPTEAFRLDARAQLVEADAPTKVLGHVSVQADVVVPDLPGEQLPYQQVVVPASWEVMLQPGRDYVVQLLIGEHLASAVAFSALPPSAEAADRAG